MTSRGIVTGGDRDEDGEEDAPLKEGELGILDPDVLRFGILDPDVLEFGILEPDVLVRDMFDLVASTLDVAVEPPGNAVVSRGAGVCVPEVRVSETCVGEVLKAGGTKSVGDGEDLPASEVSTIAPVV